MVKTVLATNYKGLQDWIVQRLTAFIMLIYSLGMIGFFLLHQDLTYQTWRTLFDSQLIKVSTILFLTSILTHTWIGIWTVITDYISFPAIRFIIQSCVFLSLLASFFWGLQILWGL